MKKVWSYKDIVYHFVKIISNGTFLVETINESILIEMLKSRGILIPIEKTLRDTKEDYTLWLKESNATA